MQWLLVLGSFLLAAVALTSAFGYELDDYPLYDDEALDVDVSKRASMSTACERCLHRANDWWSCSSCYSRRSRGFTPYYGKRSSGFSDEEADWASYSEDTPLVDKRAMLGACRCCMAYRSARCCATCDGSRWKRSMNDEYSSALAEKRSVGTGFVSGGARGSCRSCCRRSTFDFGCCLSCI